MAPTNKHTQRVVDQFSKQAVYFAKLPGHEEATRMLVTMAKITATHDVLDVACGAGAVACAAAPLARQVTGIDLTPAMIERARVAQAELGLGNLSWQIGDVSRLPFASDVFDVILTRYSLHHFPDPAKVLAEMVRVCKPAGRIAIADLMLPAEKRAAYDGMEKRRDPSHVSVLTEQEVHRLLTDVGLIDLHWAGYLFDLTLEQLLQASFPMPGDKERVRDMFEADVGVDSLGIGIHQCDEGIRFAYPITIVVGTKPDRAKRDNERF